MSIAAPRLAIRQRFERPSVKFRTTMAATIDRRDQTMARGSGREH